MEERRVQKNEAELTHEFFNTWLRIYEYTFGKFLEVPIMGPMREKYEKMMASYSNSINLFTAWTESLVNFHNVFMEAMYRMHEKMAAELEKGSNPEMYRDFYNIWIETYSETFKEFLKSGHFASDMGRLISYSTDFQENNQIMLEENFLKPMGLPTRTKIDEITGEIYSLKKSIKELNSQIRQLSGKM